MSLLAKSALFFGKIVTSDLLTAVKVTVDKYVLDERLRMYFKEKTEVYAHDATNDAKEGDYVILTKLPNPEDKKIEYLVEKVIYKQGNMIDPLTGRKCVGTEYVDDITRITEHFGCQKGLKKS